MSSMRSLLVRAALQRLYMNVPLQSPRCLLAHHKLSYTPWALPARSHVTLGTCQLMKPPSQHQLEMSPTDQKRMYAKKTKEKKDKKDKKDKSKKAGKPKVELTHEELNSAIDYDKLCHQMELAVAHLKQDYIEQLSLRTSAGMLDMLQIETPDGKFPLIQLAQIVQKNPQLFVVNLTSIPQYIPAVKDAISKSGMNLNPQQDGTTLFVPIPKVTREHRETLAKNAKVLCEKTKEKIRDIHNRFARDLKKPKAEFSQDLIHNIQETIDLTQNKYRASAEELMAMKQKELLGEK